MINYMRIHNNQDGITLLITLLLMGVLLGVSTTLLNVTLKQYQLSGITLASETAFQVASAGMECMLYHDKNPLTYPASRFDVNPSGATLPEETDVVCMGETSPDSGPDNGGANTVVSGEEQQFQFTWGTAPYQVCSDVSIYKFSSNSASVPVIVDGIPLRSTNCPQNGICTVVQSRGYNVPCSALASGQLVVEREYTQVY